MFQSGVGPVEGDEPAVAPAEPEATVRRTSVDVPPGTETSTAPTTEGRPEADSLSAAGDRTSDTMDATDGKTGKEKESAKYIEKRGYVISAVIEVYPTSMVETAKELCPLFDEIEILIPGDSTSIFPSLRKM